MTLVFRQLFYDKDSTNFLMEVVVMEQHINYLGEEKIPKLILKFSIPCILSLLISALYNIVDQIFIGNSELSALGNAATGVVFPVFVIAQAVAWCIGDGVAAYLSICQGKKDTKNLPYAVGSSITITLISSIVLMIVLSIFKVPFLTLFGASENSIGMAIEYFDIIVVFLPAFMLMNMINSSIRADGSPNVAMISVLTGAIINIILDPVFIFGLHLGMKGAAYATVIGQVMSFIIGAAYLFKPKTFKLKLKHFLVHFKTLGRVIELGMPSFITQMAIVVLMLACNTMLAKYGALSKYGVDTPIAVMAIESKVFTVVISIVVGIILGCQPIVSYNYGARNYDRVKTTYYYILSATIVVGLVSTALFEFAPHLVVRLFGNPTNVADPEAYWEFATMTFRIFLSLVTFTCIIKMNAIFFQAVGKAFFAVISSLVRDIVCLVPLVIILPRFMGIKGILYAAPIADCIAIIVAVCMTVKFMKSIDTE